jgi:hypothetical protein
VRIMMKVSLPIEAGNRAILDGPLSKTTREILEEQKPEAVYFGAENGNRTVFMVLEMRDASQIPGLAEPWFLAFNASIDMHPVMTQADLANAGPGIESAVKKFGSHSRSAGAR